MLRAAALAAALIALLAFAPLASATPDPVASGSTTLTLQKQYANYLNTFGIKVTGAAKAKVKGKKITLPVTGGEFDPTTGAGTLVHGGTLKFKAGKKKTQITALEVNATSKSLIGKVAGKKMKVAKLAGISFSRDGFGVNVTVKKVNLTSAAANNLNKKLGFAKGAPKPFLKNKLIGGSKSTEQPSTVALVPGGSMTFALNAELAKKLSDVEAKINPLTGTTVINPTTFSFPLTGGTFGPTGTAGTVQSGGGLLLAQKLPKSATEFLETEITLGGFWYDLAAKTINVEVTAKSNASSELNLGALGRSSIANVTIGGVIADPTTRSVAVQNSAAALQEVPASVLEGFVKVYEGWFAGVLKSKGMPEPMAKEEAAKKVATDHIISGAALGLISFSGQAQ
jgi:hypothetical protein